MSEQDVDLPEYVWIYDNTQGSEYCQGSDDVLCNT